MDNGRGSASASGVPWLLLAIILALGVSLALVSLDSQVGPMLCVSSGNIGPPAPAPAPPGPCPSGFGDAP